MVSYFPSPITFSPGLGVAAEEEEKRLSVVYREGALISTSSPFLLAPSLTIRSLFLTLEGVMLLASWESCLIFLQPKQAATNPLSSVILLGFQTSYDNVVPHIKQYFELHDCAYLSDCIAGKKCLCGIHSCPWLRARKIISVHFI